MLHHDAGATLDLGNLVDLADERMVERRGGTSLAMQSLASGRVVLERFGQKLDRDLAAKLRVVGQEHLAHAAFTESADHR